MNVTPNLGHLGDYLEILNDMIFNLECIDFDWLIDFNKGLYFFYVVCVPFSSMSSFSCFVALTLCNRMTPNMPRRRIKTVSFSY